MKTFLEVEGKMGPIPQPSSSQYRSPQPDTNANVRKYNTIEKRKRAVPTKKFRSSTAPKPSETAACPPVMVSKGPVNVKPQTDPPKNSPHLWKIPQFVKAPHGLVLEGCQETSSREETGCFCPTT